MPISTAGAVTWTRILRFTPAHRVSVGHSTFHYNAWNELMIDGRTCPATRFDGAAFAPRLILSGLERYYGLGGASRLRRKNKNRPLSLTRGRRPRIPANSFSSATARSEYP